MLFRSEVLRVRCGSGVFGTSPPVIKKHSHSSFDRLTPIARTRLRDRVLAVTRNRRQPHTQARGRAECDAVIHAGKCSLSVCLHESAHVFRLSSIDGQHVLISLQRRSEYMLYMSYKCVTVETVRYKVRQRTRIRRHNRDNRVRRLSHA